MNDRNSGGRHPTNPTRADTVCGTGGMVRGVDTTTLYLPYLSGLGGWVTGAGALQNLNCR